jgi:hypothetical protein
MLNPPSIEAISQDSNRDGLNDRWNITIRVRKPYAEAVLTSANVLASFNYELSSNVVMKMESLAVVQTSVPFSAMNPVTSIKTVGSLKLK